MKTYLRFLSRYRDNVCALFILCSAFIGGVTLGGTTKSDVVIPQNLSEWLNAGGPVSQVKWICPTERFEVGENKERLYHRIITIESGLVSAEGRWWFDDIGTLTVDGVAMAGSSRTVLKPLNLTAFLQIPGKHILGVVTRNLAGVGGICFSLRLRYSDGHENFVCTDSSWQWAVSKLGVDDKVLSPFGLSASHPGTIIQRLGANLEQQKWLPVRIHDDVYAGPWSTLIDMTQLLSPAEKQQLNQWHNFRAQQLDEVYQQLAREDYPLCKIVYDQGKARFDIGGKFYETTFYNTSEDWSITNRKLLRQVGYFRDAGMHLFGVGINTTVCWKEDGSIDFTPVEKVMQSALEIDPEARFFFSINTVLPPKWWAVKYPNECVGYANGIADVNERECLKNCAAPSAASLVWRREGGDYLRRVVQHFERSPLGKRIFAYRVDWGGNHEWHYYGMRGLMPDSSPVMTAAFRKWLRGTYHNDVRALQQAWHNPQVTFETASTPNKDERLRRSAGAFRHPVLERAVIDYERCHAEMLRDLLLFSNRQVKEACGGRALVGNYAGYFFGMPETAEGWHLENDAILNSPYVDFQCSPQVYGYEARTPGAAQYARCLLEGLRRRGKLAILEADNSTTFSKSTYNHWTQSTPDDIALLARDFVQTLCWGCGFWYFDFGQGWYADEAFRDYFKTIYPLRSQNADCRSVAEVLVVGDYESVMFSNVTWPPSYEGSFITKQVNELGMTGVPFDTASFRDLALSIGVPLPNPTTFTLTETKDKESVKLPTELNSTQTPLKDYKVYIFPNFYYVTPEKRAVIQRLHQLGKRLVWIGKAGCLVEGTQTVVDEKFPIPNVAIGDVVFPEPANRQQLRTLFKNEGIHIYNEDNDASLYANSSYVALHSVGIKKRIIHLPQTYKVEMLYPNYQEIGTTNTITFDSKSVDTHLFRIKVTF